MKTENYLLRNQLREAIVCWLTKIGYPKAFVSAVVPTVEDFILPTLIYDFYITKSTDFYEFLGKNSFFANSSEYTVLYNRIKNLLDAIYSEYIAVKNISSENNIKILGDIHPNYVTKYSDGVSIYYKNYPDYYDLIENLMTEALPKIKDFFPHIKKIKDNWFQREFIDVVKDGNREEIKQYYHNLGYIMPVLLTLRTVDSHQENILIKLPYPIFFDSECLFLGDVKGTEYSIFNSGLITAGEEDRSALSGGQTTAKSILKPMLFGDNKNPKIRWIVDSNASYDNIPSINSTLVNPKEYINDIENGWNESVNEILRKKQLIREIVYSTSVIFRVILKATRIYRYLLFQSVYPQNYLNKKDLNTFLLKTLKGCSNIILLKDFSSFNYEIDSIRECKIPVFYSHFKNKSIFSSENKVVAEHLRTPLDIWDEAFTKTDKGFFDKQINHLKDSL